MREAALWLSGAALAFAVTAAAFLLLANLGSGSSQPNLSPAPPPETPGPSLEISPNREQLASLDERPGQGLEVVVQNTGGRKLSAVTVNLRVASEDTALPDARYYRRALEDLAAGESDGVRFDLDLSRPEGGGGSTPLDGPGPPRRILEIQATTPEGASAVKTAILPPS